MEWREKLIDLLAPSWFADGGVKRLRIFGKRAQPATAAADAASSTKEATVGVSETDKGVDQPAKGGLSGKVSTLLSSLSSGRSSTTAATKTPSSVPPSSNPAPTSATDSASNPSAPALTIPVLPLHHSTFAPYGTVIQAYSSPSLAPPSMSIKQANAGSATKFHRLTVHESNYPEGSGEVTGISCFRTGPPEGWNGEKWEVRMFERHPYTKQVSGRVCWILWGMLLSDLDLHPCSHSSRWARMTSDQAAKGCSSLSL